jgi:signal peptidase II
LHSQYFFQPLDQGMKTLKKAVPFSRYLMFISVVSFVLAADLASKTWMFTHLRFGDPPDWLWQGVFGFQVNLNEGALFGMGQGLWPLFAALSLGAAVGIVVWLFPAGAACDRLLTIALSLVTGGILGNLYDRLGLPGLKWPPGVFNHLPNEPVHAVRDFILVMIGRWPWPTFNLADSALVCGAILLMWHAFFVKIEETEDTDNNSDPQPTNSANSANG